MSLFVSSLNSGSNGNCYYVGNDEEGVLIDAGISCRETEKRLKRIGLTIKKVKAVFISHEHGDHIHGLEGLAKKHRLPVYITEKTFNSCKVKVEPGQLFSFSAHQKIEIGQLTITGFPKYHDAIDPHSFIVSGETVTVGVFTDIGAACDQVKYYFSQCHAAFLESNYDEDMLEQGPYPYPLKQRIRGGHGHLSNTQALDLFTSYKGKLSHLFLSHLSRENNSPKLVKNIFSRAAGNTQIIVSSREKELPLHHIRSHQTIRIKPLPGIQATKAQLQLF